MKVLGEYRSAGRERRLRRLLCLGRRISRLAEELETLNFIQDHLERELEARPEAPGAAAEAGRPGPRARRG